ncbi:MAG TPA: acyl-CoA dehydrogenase, partial [Agromyces sp.]|nr:acyl-CoA dehydrogenase [Agromyces sp.]
MVDTASRTDTTPAPKVERPGTTASASEATPANTPIDAAAAPVVDVAALGRQLLGTGPDARIAARERAADPAFQRIEGQSMAEHRERVLGQLKLLVESGAV